MANQEKEQPIKKDADLNDVVNVLNNIKKALDDSIIEQRKLIGDQERSARVTNLIIIFLAAISAELASAQVGISLQNMQIVQDAGIGLLATALIYIVVLIAYVIYLVLKRIFPTRSKNLP